MQLAKQIAIPTIECTIRIWGGPGSGKTSYATQIVQSYGVSPSELAALTLRKKMADDLARKLTQQGIADSSDELPYCSTMHGVIRRWFDFPSDASIYGNREAGTPNLQKAFFEERRIPFNESGEDIFGTIPDKLGNLFLALRTWLIHTMHKPQEWGKAPLAAEFIRHGGGHRLFMRLLKEYEDFKLDNDLWDFDDLILAALRSDQAPPVKLVLVDECQDNSLAMHAITAKWAQKIPIVILAGDPNQSIYGFLGSDPKLFWNHTKARKEINLEKCYRIPENTWEVAKSILEASRHPVPDFKFDKKEGIVKRIAAHKLLDILRQHPWPAFHLVRANFQRERIAELLIKVGRPFKGYASRWTDADFHLYNAIFEIRKYAENGFDSEKLIPLPYLKRLAEVFPKQFFNCKKNEITSEWEWKEIHKVLKPLLISRLLSPDPLAHTLKSGISETQKLKVVNALRYNDRKLTEADLHRIMTIHEAKGLECDTVFLYSEWTRKIKHEANFREEARVWFVGATRHRHMLIIVDGLFSDFLACETCPFLRRWEGD